MMEMIIRLNDSTLRGNEQKLSETGFDFKIVLRCLK